MLWTDHFKAAHFEKHPQLHTLFHEATKLAGAAGTKGGDHSVRMQCTSVFHALAPGATSHAGSRSAGSSGWPASARIRWLIASVVPKVSH